MKHIPITQGFVALVDDDDFEWLSQLMWCALKGRRTTYATTTIDNRTVRMHRLILNAPQGVLVDHVNHDGLDNRKANLRFATMGQNLSNKPLIATNHSGYKGVYWNKANAKWHAQIRHKGKLKHLGYFDCLLEAASAYNHAATELFGEFACLNDL